LVLVVGFVISVICNWTSLFPGLVDQILAACKKADTAGIPRIEKDATHNGLSGVEPNSTVDEDRDIPIKNTRRAESRTLWDLENGPDA
jgi:hypothetical protein